MEDGTVSSDPPYSNERLTAEVRALRIALTLLIHQVSDPKQGTAPAFFRGLAQADLDITDETRAAFRHMGAFSAEIEDIVEKVHSQLRDARK